MINKPGKSHDLEQFLRTLKPVHAQYEIKESHWQQCILGYHPSVPRRRLVFFGPQIVETTNWNLAADYWGVLDAFRFAMMEELDRYINYSCCGHRISKRTFLIRSVHAPISVGAQASWSCCCAGSAICYSFTVDLCFFLRTSENQLGEEGLHGLKFSKSSAEDGELLQQRKQRARTRLHLAVSSLKGQSTEDNVSIQ